MKNSTLLLLSNLLLIITACGQSNNPEDFDYGYGYDEEGYANDSVYGQPAGETVNEPVQAPAQNGSAEIVMHKTHNPQTGMVSEYIPLPSYWKITPQGWVGPHNAKVQPQKGALYTEQQRQIYSIDQIIQQDLLPHYRQQGYQYVGSTDLPQVARKDQEVYSQYWQAMPSENSHAAKALEFKDNKGTRGMVVVHFILSRSQYGSLANYYLHVLTADPKGYERAKKEMIYALANYQPNPQAIAAHNQREQQKSNASWSAHNSRMRANQQNFDNWQRTQQTLSEANDISYEGWKRRNAIQDEGHSKTIDAIRGVENVRDPYYGNQQYEVESGYKYYYMNQFGEYIGTNDEFYNPSTDPNRNNVEWRKVNSPY